MTKEAEGAVLEKIVQDYNQTDNPGRYRVVREPSGTITVIGTQVKDETGTFEEVKPVLETAITIPRENRSVYETVRAILSAVSEATGKKMLVGLVPNNDFLSSTATIGGKDSARDFLLQALAATGRPMYYTIGYDPDPVPPVYILNVSVVMKLRDNGSGIRRPVPVDRQF
jgi:hypothetical protein